VNLQAGDSAKQTVRKAVIAAAGYGTRFLPQTKAMPKEMLPIVDKPIITGYHKRSIEDHFDVISAGLAANLREAGKAELLEQMKKISNLANFAYIRQKGPYGNATPLLNAEHFIRDEPFIYTWGDDFVLSQPSRFRQIVETYQQTNGSVLTCIPAQREDDYKRYAFIDGREVSRGLVEVSGIIEKPGTKEASPSDIASVGGYLFRPEIFSYLKTAKDKLQPGEEFIFQPSIQNMIRDGKFYDTGNKLEYLKTVVDFALMHDELKDEFKDYLKSLE
jgi:UTP--glucose-1-phosphate uridylyltransferase